MTTTVQNVAVEARGFKPFRKNTFRSLVDLPLAGVGLVLLGCTLHEKNGSSWIGLPARPYKNDNGDTSWTQIINITLKEARSAFQGTALVAVEEPEQVRAEGGVDGF